MTRVLTVTVALSLSALAGVLAQDAEFEKLAAEALDVGELAEVKDICVRWGKAEPESVKPHLFVARAYVRANMVDRALEELEMAREKNPLDPGPICQIGDLYRRAGKLDEAIKEFSAALRLSRRCIAAHVGLSQVHTLQKKLETATREAQTAISIDPQAPAAHVALGDVHRVRAAQLTDAVDAYQTALKLDAKCADALHGLAVVLELMGNNEEAQGLWRKFVSVESVTPRGLRARNGWVVLRRKRLPSGCRYYPVWSPDAKRIMFGYGVPQILSLRDQTVTKVRADDNGKLFNQCWSPDGKQVLLQRPLPNGGRGVSLYNLSPDGTLELARPEPLCESVAGRFSPDGTRVLLSAAAVRRGERRISFGLAIFDLTAGQVRGIPWRQEGRMARNHGAWGPDGASVVFHAYGADANDRALFMMPIDASEKALQLTYNEAANMTPAISPDGRTIAYVEKRGTDSTVCLALANGDAVRVALGPGMNPEWSPDGRRLVYYSSGNNVIVHLAGLSASPVLISAQQENAQLTITLINQGEDPAAVDVQYEIFDPDSVRIAGGSVGDQEMVIEAAARAERTLDLTPADGLGECVVKLTAVTTEGARAIELVDVSVP